MANTQAFKILHKEQLWGSKGSLNLPQGQAPISKRVVLVIMKSYC